MEEQKKWIVIQAYKHNGELHRQWSHGFMLKETDDFYMICSVRASVLESDGRKWHTKEPAVFILSKNKWFNVIAMLKEDGISYYVNIASPTILDKGFLKYIDYDLDIKLFGDGSTKLLDVSEYEKHADEQNYGLEIKDVLSLAVNDVYSMIKAKKFPFDDAEIERLYSTFQNITR